MPFLSQAQRGFMYAKKPELAKEFESKTPKGKKLPKHVKKSKKVLLNQPQSSNNASGRAKY